MANTSASLSAKQRCLLWYLVDFRSNKGVAPSIREMREFCNMSSTSVVDYHLERLRVRGLVTRLPVARGTVATLEGMEEVERIRREEMQR